MPEETTPHVRDYRDSNPKLHLLYVKWAVEHLSTIDKMAKKLFKFSNTNMYEVGSGLVEAAKKLCRENTAYADADEILRSIDKKYNSFVEAKPDAVKP